LIPRRSDATTVTSRSPVSLAFEAPLAPPVGQHSVAAHRFVERPVSDHDPEPERGRKIAYLCAQYPAISHTFVLREVTALRALGAEITTFSIRRAASDHLLARADHVAFETTYPILPPRWLTLLASHLQLVLKSPAAYLSTLAWALGQAQGGLRSRLWQCFYFAESVVLWRQCRRRGIRHVHAHMANVATDVAGLVSRIGSAVEPDRPWSWSFTLHGPAELFETKHYGLANKVRDARFVVCISDFTRSQLMALSDVSEWSKLHVVHVGVPIEQFTTRAGGGAVKGDPDILFVGRLVPEKGHAVLLEAVALLEKRGRSANLTLAGDGPSRPVLEQLAEELGIAARTSFLGSVGQDEIHALYVNASIFCLPSFAEGLPTVLMEAMAMELPVVSTRITGVPELVEDARTGLLVTPGRPDLLADALERLLTDLPLCRELGANARKKVIREFNATTSAAQLFALLGCSLDSVA
jgi:colanic acid/amylovoran biosynthesis glycosyltransferase